jgi:IS30 family transposase
MGERHRRRFTAAESAEIWDRWRRGEGLKSIGRVFGKTSSSIFAHLRPHGGIRPAPRRRATAALSLAEREEISRGVASGASLRSIAVTLGRAPSTISRELGRNGGRSGYRATAADKRAWDCALRPKPCKLETHGHLRFVVANRLEAKWSPQQIAGWLRRSYPEDKARQVSHETIYKSLFVQARGVLKKELMAHLRAAGAIRRSRHATAKGDSRGRIADTVSIRERPASVEDRAVPGHWEGDLLCGSSNSYIVTLVERHSRYVMLAKITNRDSASVVNALIEQARALPAELCRSLTWDRRPKRWPSTGASPWRRTSPSTSATHRARGSAAPTRTPIGCSASISPRASIWQPTRRTSSTRSPES